MSSYNSRIAFSPAGQSDSFKTALFKLMGKIEPHKKSLGVVTAMTEDWIWFQLMMVDEIVDAGPSLAGAMDPSGGSGLRDLGEVLESYGERHFLGESPSAPLGSSGSFAGSPNPLATSTNVTGHAGIMNAAKKVSWARLLLSCGLFEKVCP